MKYTLHVSMVSVATVWKAYWVGIVLQDLRPVEISLWGVMIAVLRFLGRLSHMVAIAVMSCYNGNCR